MAPIGSNTRALCLVVLLLMSTTFLSCHASGTAGGWTKFCVAEKACAPTAGPKDDHVCKADCGRQGYDKDKSYCAPDPSGICCCQK
ncbi:hypothetical protein CFC21_091685 [Triticum aestivum]|uniref:Uncharacterized protein n=3 Tax=Triticinae TaxID=1648030 RepID=A0A453N9H8_AEGTS|nr:hypothetical protein CFC21_091685 [Triticum aestivum]